MKDRRRDYNFFLKAERQRKYQEILKGDEQRNRERENKNNLAKKEGED